LPCLFFVRFILILLSAFCFLLSAFSFFGAGQEFRPLRALFKQMVAELVEASGTGVELAEDAAPVAELVEASGTGEARSTSL
jgi:hypothetical protein